MKISLLGKLALGCVTLAAGSAFANVTPNLQDASGKAVKDGSGACVVTSGVVLPTFLPTAPGLVQQVGGGDPLAVALSINVGSSLVDVSPLSTIGAICVAALSNPDLARDLFRKMLVWGLSMTLVGGVLCQLFAGWFARL